MTKVALGALSRVSKFRRNGIHPGNSPVKITSISPALGAYCRIAAFISSNICIFVSHGAFAIIKSHSTVTMYENADHSIEGVELTRYE